MNGEESIEQATMSDYESDSGCTCHHPDAARCGNGVNDQCMCWCHRKGPKQPIDERDAKIARLSEENTALRQSLAEALKGLRRIAAIVGGQQDE